MQLCKVRSLRYRSSKLYQEIKVHVYQYTMQLCKVRSLIFSKSIQLQVLKENK